jgi:wobble nucleotide-excising tRNase
MKNFFKKQPKLPQGPTVEDRLAALESKIEAERILKEEAEAAKQQVELELAAAKTAISANEEELTLFRDQAKANEEKRNSSEPWVEVVGESIDPVKGIEIKLDWNDAFIKFLQASGIQGTDEDVIVQKWLALLYQDLFETLEDRAINTKSDKTVSDYL